MDKFSHLKQSDYRRRGYTSLHIKRDTRDRLNMVRTVMAAQAGAAISQDDVLNSLLDSHASEVVESCQLQPTP